MAFSISNVAAKAALDAVVDLLDQGTSRAQATLVIYSGTAPATADAALAGNTVLAQVSLQNPGMSAAADANPNATSSMLGVPLEDISADADGTASFCRFLDRDLTPVIQDDCKTSGSSGLLLNSLSFQTGRTVKINSYVLTQPEVAT